LKRTIFLLYLMACLFSISFADVLVYRTDPFNLLRIYDLKEGSKKWLRWKITDFEASEELVVYHDTKGSFYLYDIKSQKEIYLGRNVSSYRMDDRFIAYEDSGGRLFAAEAESGKLRLVTSHVKHYGLSGPNLIYIDSEGWLKTYSIRNGREKKVVEGLESFQLSDNYLVYNDSQQGVWFANPRFPRPERIEDVSGRVVLMDQYLIFGGTWGDLELYDLRKKEVVYSSSDIRELFLTRQLMVYSMNYGGLMVRELRNFEERILGDFHGVWRAAGMMIGFQHWGKVVFYDHQRNEKFNLGPGLFDFAVGKGGIAYRVGPSDLRYFDADSGEVISIAGNVSSFQIIDGSDTALVIHPPQNKKFQALYKTLDQQLEE